ncbi:hypothetical protein [Nocardia tengchongensis]|uniref:hypothetical protein n=1 Tax=Nocardia tengchongensis TaxID=2055889 RepID=UPI00367B80A5
MDQILYWNAVALESDRKAHTEIDPVQPGPRGPIGRSRALAIVHLAMHDAIFSIFGAPHGTWLTAPPVAATGALPDAAIAVAQRNDVEQNARLFALVNIALADAAILCRDDPSHPSVHAAFGGAAFQTIRRYYDVPVDGPDILTDGLGFVSGELDGTATDGHGRADLSQHIGGVRLGRDVADDLWAAGLRQDQAAGPWVP